MRLTFFTRTDAAAHGQSPLRENTTASGAAPYGVGDKVMTIDFFPRHGKKYLADANFTRVISKPADRLIEIAVGLLHLIDR